MAVTLTISGVSYSFPSNADSPSWGEEVTAWATAVTSALTTVSGTGDILQTIATISNNQSSATNVALLAFDGTQVRAAVVEYSIYRVSTLEEKVECGTLYVNYKSVAGVWEVVQAGSGSGGVTLTITSAGQVQYTSDNMTGISYSGTMKFRARSLGV